MKTGVRSPYPRVRIDKDGKHHRIWRALDGTPAQHTPDEDLPYYYDRFALFNCGWKSTDAVLKSEDVIRCPEYRTYCMRVFHDESQIFTSRDPMLVQILISMVLGRPVVLTGIEEENHDSGGYPYWFFYYREPSNEMSQSMKAEFYDALLERDKTLREDLKSHEKMMKVLFGRQKQTACAVVKTISQSEYTEGIHWASAQDAKELICVFDDRKKADEKCEELRKEFMKKFEAFKGYEGEDWDKLNGEYTEHPGNTSFEVIETEYFASGNIIV